LNPLGWFARASRDQPPLPAMHGRDPMPRVPYKNLTQSDELAEKLEMSTAEIGLSVRTTNCLEEKGIFTVHDLLNCTRSDLLSISNFGEKTLEEVYRALEKIGFFRKQPRADAEVVVHQEFRNPQ
jgi:DNA-directed RNA polymerase subunit alpha